MPELVDPEMAKDEYVKESGSERQGAKEGATEKDAEKQMVDAEEKDKVKATHVKSKTSEQTDQLRPRTTSRMSAEESVVSSDSFGEGMQNLTYTPDPQLILHDLFDVQPLPVSLPVVCLPRNRNLDLDLELTCNLAFAFHDA